MPLPRRRGANRRQYPLLQEVGERTPHQCGKREPPGQVAALLGCGSFDRVLGSLHSLPDHGEYAEPPGLYEHRTPADVMRGSLAEVTALVADSGVFEVLAHVDYAVRSRPAAGGPFVPEALEEEFRDTLRSIAEAGRVLEISTVVPFHATLLRWWCEEGGKAVTFGSDAHEPGAVARGFRDAAHLAESHGSRPGPRLYDVWARS